MTEHENPRDHRIIENWCQASVTRFLLQRLPALYHIRFRVCRKQGWLIVTQFK